MDWYRWWHGTSTDPKFQMVAIDCSMNVSCVLGLWAVLLEQASSNDPRGSFKPDFDVLSFQLGIDVVTPCNAMKRRGLLHETDGLLHIVNWEKRQPKRERSDNSTQRVSAWREKQKQNVTPCNAMQHQETPRLEKIREDKYIPPIEKNLFEDYKQVRKAKGVGVLTETAFKGIQREAQKAGLSDSDAIRICCEKNWVGFKAEWYFKEYPRKELKVAL